MGASQMSAARGRSIFALEPGVEPIRALRKALKVLLRAYGLRCVTIEEHPHGQKEAIPNSAASADRADACSGSTASTADRRPRLASTQRRPSRSTRELEGCARISRARQELATSRLSGFNRSQIRGSSAHRNATAR